MADLHDDGLEQRIARLEALLYATLQPSFREHSASIDKATGAFGIFHELRRSALSTVTGSAAMRALVELFQGAVQTRSRVNKEILSWKVENDEERRRLQLLLDGYLYAISFSLDIDAVPLQRILPARIYVAQVPPRAGRRYDPVALIRDVFLSFLAESGFQEDETTTAEYGSWFARFFARTTDFLTRREAEDHLRLAEYALRQGDFGREQAEINKAQAEAAAALLEALKGTGNSAVQIGPLLLLRFRDADGEIQTIIRTLSPTEMQLLEQNQHALKDPKSVLTLLAKTQPPG